MVRSRVRGEERPRETGDPPLAAKGTSMYVLEIATYQATPASFNNKTITMKILSVVVALTTAASAFAFAPSPMGTRAVTVSKMAASEEFYIDEERRFLMNLILLGSAAVTVGGLAVPYIAFFVPPGSGGGSGGSTAKDALGNDIFAKEYLASKPAKDRSLAQGLKGDAT